MSPLRIPFPSLLVLSGLALAMMGPSARGVQPNAGEVLFSQGIATSQRSGAEARIIGKGEQLKEGDVLSTGASSVALIQLQDGSRMTLRPGTVFTVEKFSVEAGKENALFRLFKGGLRAVTGFISKRNPDAYQVRTVTATIGIRGTDFDARLCTNDCAQESRALGAVGAKDGGPRAVIARVALVKGEMGATAPGVTLRPLALGGPVYTGDTLETGKGGFAVVVFRDGTRVTLQERTRFQVQSYQYEETKVEESSVIFRLIKGGLRAVTGVIAKRRPQAFAVQTATATIGIRGTGFDSHCGGPCALEAPESATPQLPAQVGDNPDAGLFVSTWDGAIELRTSIGAQLVAVNQTAFVGSINQIPMLLPALPAFMRDFPAPRPDTVPVDMKNLFGAEARSTDQAGLYVWVRDGHVALTKDDQTIDLGKNEAAYAGLAPQEVNRVDVAPMFMQFDPVPRPDQVPAGTTITPLFRTPGGLLQDNECEVR